MKSASLALLVAAGIGQAAVASNILVVADSACPMYAVDIESFATCDGDRVASMLDQEVARIAEVAMATDAAPHEEQEREAGAIAPR